MKAKMSKGMDVQRINGATPNVITRLFKKLVLLTIKNIYREHPYNMYETGIVEGMGMNGLVVGPVRRKMVVKKHPDSRIWATIVECFSAKGQVLETLVVFKGDNIEQ